MPGQKSGRAFVTLAASGQNSIVVAGGANTALSSAHVPLAARREAHVLLSQLETPVEAIKQLFSGPHMPGAVRILNAAPALPEGRALFPLVDVLVVNETELMTYAGLRTVEEAASVLLEAALGLIDRPEQAVILTLGPTGAAIVQNGKMRMVAGHAVQAIDTTGAGDCFCGVLAAELDRGADLETAVYFANAAAALSVTRLGAATSAPSRAEVETFLSGT
jgi:ribokinase